MTSISSGAFSSSVTGANGRKPSRPRADAQDIQFVSNLGLPRSRYEVRRHKVRQSTAPPATSWGDKRLVFTSRAGTVLYARNVQRTAQGLRSRRGSEITPHELRHTAASLMVDDGQALEQVADYLGHGLNTHARFHLPPPRAPVG